MTAPAALPAPTLPDLSMALVPIGGQLAKAIDSDFRVRLNPFYSITFTIPFYLIETSLMIRFYTSTKIRSYHQGLFFAFCLCLPAGHGDWRWTWWGAKPRTIFCREVFLNLSYVAKAFQRQMYLSI